MNVFIHESSPTSQFCCIWLHGLGSDGNDMLGLAKQIRTKAAVKHVSLNAPIRPVTINNHMKMRAWYDITGGNLTDREDKAGITQSEQEIIKAIEAEYKNGFAYNQIFIAGFSQGGAMALYTGLRFKKNLAGIVSLSSYLPLADEFQDINRDLSIFMGAGQFDTMVYPQWTMQTYQWLRANGIDNIAKHEYPIAHSVSIAEIEDLSRWIDVRAEQIITDLGDR